MALLIGMVLVVSVNAGYSKNRNISGALGHELYTIEAAPNGEQVEIIPLENFLPHITEKSIQYLEDQEETTNLYNDYPEVARKLQARQKSFVKRDAFQ